MLWDESDTSAAGSGALFSLSSVFSRLPFRVCLAWAGFWAFGSRLFDSRPLNRQGWPDWEVPCIFRGTLPSFLRQI